MSPWVLSDPLRLFRSHRWDLCLLSVPLPPCCLWGPWFLSVPWLPLDLFPEDPLHPSHRLLPYCRWIQSDPSLPLDLCPEGRLHLSSRLHPLSQWLLCCRWDLWIQSGLSLPLDLFPVVRLRPSSPLRLSRRLLLDLRARPLRRWSLWFPSTPSSSRRRELPAARWSLSFRLGLFLLSTP